LFHLAHDIFLWIVLILTLDWGFCSDWLISSSCVDSLGTILDWRHTLEGFTSLWSLNSYFNYIRQIVVPLASPLGKKTLVGLRVWTLLSFETQGFASWNYSSQTFYNEWWYGGWARLSSEGLCAQILEKLEYSGNWGFSKTFRSTEWSYSSPVFRNWCLTRIQMKIWWKVDISKFLQHD